MPKDQKERKGHKRDKQELEKLGLGSSKTSYAFSYDPSLLEKVENHYPQHKAWTTFICPEFTSLCPKTNQPDFATLYLNYIARESFVESKSLKLYLFSFRNHGDFHEDCVQLIAEDIFTLIRPYYLEVLGEFTPRGGIAIYPYAQRFLQKDPFFVDLANQRLLNYSPGRYSL